jgi:hypothetical protein
VRKGGGVSIQPTRDQSGRESHHDTKEGFQVSKREAQGIGVGISKQRGIIKGLRRAPPYIMLILYILC